MGNSENNLSVNQKKEWAKQLFTRDELTQKDIALTVGISEKTMSKWVNDENWDTLRKTLLTSNDQQLRFLYECLDLLNQENKEALSDDDPGTKPNLDGVSKLTKSIKNLQKDLGVEDMIEAFMQLVRFVRQVNVEDSKIINRYADLLVQSKMSAHK